MRIAFALLTLSLVPAARHSPAGSDFILEGPVPASIGLASVEVDGRVLPLGPAAWRRSGAVVERDFGAVIERYVIEERRVEQIFVVRERCAGPIVVRSRLQAPLPVVRETESWSDVELAGGGLVMTDGSTRLLYYGAVAIDARGRELPLRPRWERGHAVLAVPAEFVASAEFPLTIDPWIQFGGSGTSVGVSNTTSFVADVAHGLNAAGNSNLAWIALDASGVPQVYFRRWNGSAWEELGGSGSGSGISAGSGDAATVELALDGSGNPQIAWSGIATASGFNEVYFRRWNGSSWEQLAGSGTGEGITPGGNDAYNPSLVLDASANPAIAFQRFTGTNDQIYLLNWNGAAWAELAGSNTGNGISNAATIPSAGASLATNAAGKLAVAWTGVSGGNQEIFYREFNPAGPSWDALGGSGAGGGLSATALNSSQVSLALESGGNPVVAWRESAAEFAIYLRRWSGAAWLEIGGSATGTGLSGADQYAYLPSLALDASNNPRIAWEAHLGSAQHVYYREWNGASWAERDGSATGTGVDQRPGPAQQPRLALTGTGLPVIAWYETQAYVRAFQATTFTSLSQHLLDGSALTTGATTPETAVKFRGAFAGDTFSWRLQIETQPVGTGFTGVPQAESVLMAPGQTAEVTLAMANGAFHWQARVLTAGGPATAWVSFGGNTEAETDVTVAFVGTTTIVNNTTKKDKCGLLGVEAALVLLALAIRRGCSAR